MSFEEVSPSFTRESYRPPGVPPEIHTVHILGFVGCNISLILYGTPVIPLSKPGHQMLTALQGVALSIFVQCVKALVKTLKPSDPSHRTRVIQLAYACSIFTAGTLFIAADTWSNIISTLEYPLYPGGPVGWILEHYNHPVVVLGNISFLLTTWLSDGFMVSRRPRPQMLIRVTSPALTSCDLWWADVQVLRDLHADDTASLRFDTTTLTLPRVVGFVLPLSVAV